MNNKTRLRVALIWGGRGYESEVSRRGKDHILPILSEKYDILSTFIDKNGQWIWNGRKIFIADGGFIDEDGGRIPVDCVIPLLHGDYGEDGVVQGALENFKIPYIGCDTSASAICRDKSILKAVAEGLGIPTLPFVRLLLCEGIDFAVRQVEASLDYPIFIKPCRLGSSVGATAARDRNELISALKSAFSLCDRVIAEPCLIEKRELECGYFAADGREIFSFPGEILLEGTYGYEEKYTHHTCLSVRADIPTALAHTIRDYSRRLTRALGIRDMSRIDFFLSGEKLYFNEINTFPGFTEASLYAKMIEAAGVTEAELFDRLIFTAIGR